MVWLAPLGLANRCRRDGWREASKKNSQDRKSWLSGSQWFATGEGWLYLAGYKDIFTGEIIGYAMHKLMNKDLVVQALFPAVALKCPAEGLIVHSDRGSQYCSSSFIRVLKQFGIQASMSPTGNCYDNAPMESFYNRQRIPKRLGYCSPAAFERKYFSEMKKTERFGVND